MHLTFWFILKLATLKVMAWPPGKQLNPAMCHLWTVIFRGEFWLYWAQQQAWLLVWKAQLYQPGLTGTVRRPRPPFSLWALPLLHFSRFNNTYYQSDRNQGAWKRKKTGTVKLRNTIWGERGKEAADIKCEDGKTLGSEQLSWKMGKSATVTWMGIYEPVLCPAQEARFYEYRERIIFHLRYSCAFVYSTRWENLHPNSRNAQKHEYYLYLIKSLVSQA